MDMLTRETFTGPWAGLPVAWTDADRFDEERYRECIARCCAADVPGIYSGGTSGEFYAMEFDEFKEVTRATVEACHESGKPAMVGCTSTYTRGAMQRAEYAASIGADAIQVGFPFWMEISESSIVPFFKDVNSASGGLPLSIYETTRSKRILTIDQHREIHAAIPNYIMVKSNANTIGTTVEGCRALSEFVNVFVDESRWANLGPVGARGSCSAIVYYNPPLALKMWSDVEQADWESVARRQQQIHQLHQFLFAEFGSRGFTDTAYDRLGSRATGFLGINLNNRAPYISATEEDVVKLREWCEGNFPELLSL